MKALLATPLPPPDWGGIGSWTRCVQVGLGNRPDVELQYVDTKLWFRSVIDTSITGRWLGGAVQAVGNTWQVRQRLRHFRPDVFHLCTSAGPSTAKDLLMVRIAARQGVPSVLHYHMGKLPAIIANGGLEWRLMRQAMLASAAVVVLNRSSREALESALPALHVLQIPNMIDLDAIDTIRQEQRDASSTANDGRIRIAFIGHVVPGKGTRELVSACSKLPRDSFTLDIVGPCLPAFQKELLDLSGRSNQEQWLRMHGPVDHTEAIRQLELADLFLLPSHSEGMPYVVMEAMACGKPIIASSVGAIPEMLDIDGPQQCGICVPPKDVKALSEVLAQLISDRALQKEYGRCGRNRAEKLYSNAVGCSCLLDLWRSASCG